MATTASHQLLQRLQRANIEKDKTVPKAKFGTNAISERSAD